VLSRQAGRQAGRSDNRKADRRPNGAHGHDCTSQSMFRLSDQSQHDARNDALVSTESTNAPEVHMLHMYMLG